MKTYHVKFDCNNVSTNLNNFSQPCFETPSNLNVKENIVTVIVVKENIVTVQVDTNTSR
jgi:hypothetical protein